MEFPERWGIQTKKPSVGGYGYFLEQYIEHSTVIE